MMSLVAVQLPMGPVPAAQVVHGWHSDAPASEAKVPFAHGCGAPLPSGHAVPGGQMPEHWRYGGPYCSAELP